MHIRATPWLEDNCRLRYEAVSLLGLDKSGVRFGGMEAPE